MNRSLLRSHREPTRLFILAGPYRAFFFPPSPQRSRDGFSSGKLMTDNIFCREKLIIPRINRRVVSRPIHFRRSRPRPLTPAANNCTIFNAVLLGPIKRPTNPVWCVSHTLLLWFCAMLLTVRCNRFSIFNYITFQ